MRLTGPPRFIGVPGRIPTPAAPTPGVTTARRATGATGRATQPFGRPTVLQYTTALADPAVRGRAVSAASANPARHKVPMRAMAILHPNGASAPDGPAQVLPAPARRGRGSELGVILVVHVRAAALHGGPHALKGPHRDDPQPHLLLGG